MTTSNIPNLSSMSMVKAKVDLYKGSTLVKTFTCGDALSDFTVTREGDTCKFFGFGICHKLDLNLIDLDRELTVTKENTVEIGLGDGGEIWDAPYPTFYIAEVQRDEKSNTITGTAYDKLYWASEYLFKDLGLTAPYTLVQVAQVIATKLGLTLKTDAAAANAFSLSYAEGANLAGTEDLRSVLNWIAEATQTIYFITQNNELSFKRLDRDGEAVLNIMKDDYYELNTKTQRVLTLICHTTELGDNLEATTGDGGAIQYIRNNPFLELRTDLTTLLDNAINDVGGTVITQFDCDWVGNYLLEAGDKLALETEDGGIVYSYLLSDTVTYTGALNEVSSWEYTDQQPETYANPTNIGDRINQTFARVDKIEKNITLYVGEVVEEELTGITSTQTNHTERISSLELDTEGIKSSVETVQKNVDTTNGYIDTQTKQLRSELQQTANGLSVDIQTVRESGVTKVTTSTGYTFNEDGLTISKSTSDISTQITEDGMTVNNATTELLSATSEGVSATDLRARTYLSIGDRSRFENYGTARTGCFWIGE